MRMDPHAIATIVTFLTGGGLITLITQMVRARTTIKTGALSSTRAVVKDLVEARNEAEQRLDHQTARADYWQGLAANYAYQLRSAGIIPDPEKPVPPIATAALKQEERRRRRTAARDHHDLEDSGDILS